MVIIGIAISVNSVPIRLTEERWNHIITGHPEVKEMFESVTKTISKPDHVFLGNNNELLAIRKEQDKYVVAVYRETSHEDGFVITAFTTKKISKLKRRLQVWPR
jgi:hypothetical protein